jgi:ribosomal protein S28E/S33
MRSAMMRPMMSEGPPAVYATIIVIGREGYTCAVTLVAIPKVTATTDDDRTIFRICMAVFPSQKREDVVLRDLVFTLIAA